MCIEITILHLIVTDVCKMYILKHDILNCYYKLWICFHCYVLHGPVSFICVEVPKFQLTGLQNDYEYLETFLL